MSEERKDAIVNGIVLTTSKVNSRVFAAGFVMVHQDNKRSHELMNHEQFRIHAKISVQTNKFIMDD